MTYQAHSISGSTGVGSSSGSSWGTACLVAACTQKVSNKNQRTTNVCRTFLVPAHQLTSSASWIWDQAVQTCRQQRISGKAQETHKNQQRLQIGNLSERLPAGYTGESHRLGRAEIFTRAVRELRLGGTEFITGTEDEINLVI